MNSPKLYSRPSSRRPILPHDMPRRNPILDDAAERVVDGALRRAGAARERAGEDLADLAEQMVRADRAGRERVQIFGALGAHAFFMVGEEAGAGDQRVVDLDRTGAG